MNVDQELARAVEEAEAEGSVPAVAQAPATARGASSKPKSSWGLLTALLVIVAGVLTLAFTGLSGAFNYTIEVDRLVKEQAQFAKRNVKLQGMLVKGTLVRRDEPCEYRFKLHDEKHKDSVIPVQYRQCVVPDTFRDMPGMDVMVTAGGKLAPDGKSFEATDIMAKCPSKYEMQQRSMAGEAAPHVGKQASPLQTISQKD
ncbi:MAG TPA: cytochrome c maturation protein CcmE [Polyangiaceae bacterium]|nr:cytochrome c maturation protein CcmE [Polyangiaceae bacterium]